MAVLQILEFPDPQLRKVAVPVATFGQKLNRLVDNMIETMYEAEGIGLAATQVNVHKRLLVIDISENKDSPQVFINPNFDILDHDLAEYDEGCLSVPGFYETVCRPRAVKISAVDRDGNSFELEAEGLLATCIQHEIDHLNGKLFVDYISTLKRNRIRDKLEKDHKKLA
jgi:peptide deformylase